MFFIECNKRKAVAPVKSEAQFCFNAGFFIATESES